MSKGSLGRVDAVTYAEHQRQVLREVAYKAHGLAPLAAAKGLFEVVVEHVNLGFFWFLALTMLRLDLHLKTGGDDDFIPDHFHAR